MKLTIVMLCLLLSACTTFKLWEFGSQYSETVQGFYLVQDRYEVLALGDEFSYIFEVDPKMYEAFKLSKEIDFNLRFNSFSANEENRVSGNIRLFVSKKNLNEDNALTLKKLGFSEGRRYSLELENDICGTRFIGKGGKPITRFEKPYSVTVKLPASRLLDAGKVIATPATLMFDTLVLTPIVIGTLLIYSVNGSFN